MKRLDIREAMGIAIAVTGLVFLLIAALVRVAQSADMPSWAVNVFEQFAIGIITIGAALLIVESNLARYLKATSERQELLQHRQRVLRQLNSRINSIAVRAAEELAENGWLRDGTLSGISLDNANLGNTFFAGAVFGKASLEHVNASNADWREANLEGAELSFANMCGSDLTGAKFKDANLFYANLKGAILDGADFRGADLENANLQNAHLFGVTRYWDEVGGDSITYPAAQFDSTTILPDGQLWQPSTDMLRFTSSRHPNFFVPSPPQQLDVDLSESTGTR
jgi:hypothetical protein